MIRVHLRCWFALEHFCAEFWPVLIYFFSGAALYLVVNMNVSWPQSVGEICKQVGGVHLFYFPTVSLSYYSSYLAKQPLILFEVQPELRDYSACPLKIAGVAVASCVLDFVNCFAISNCNEVEKIKMKCFSAEVFQMWNFSWPLLLFRL